MHHHVDGERPGAANGDDLLVLAVMLIGLVLFGGVPAWGIRDADAQARARLVADTAAPQRFEVDAGLHSPTAEEEFAAYYPSTLRAHPGDTIRFTNPTIEDPHSVTFGLRPDRSNQPRFGSGSSLPVLNGACASDLALTPASTLCEGVDDVARLPAFSGQRYFSSGIIPPGGGVFELRLATTLEPGTYTFTCVIHPAQTGTLEVVEQGEPTQRPRDLARRATQQVEADADELQRIRGRAGRPRPDGPEVQAGSASARASLNVFLPRALTVDAGTAVTWTNPGPVPHVMIFGGSLTPPEAIDTPPTRPDGATLTRGLFTTGPVGAPPYPRTSFTLRFDEPGSYPYICTLHPGMTGTVTVR